MEATGAGVGDRYPPPLQRRPRARGALDLLGDKSQDPTKVLTHTAPPVPVSGGQAQQCRFPTTVHSHRGWGTGEGE